LIQYSFFPFVLVYHAKFNFIPRFISLKFSTFHSLKSKIFVLIFFLLFVFLFPASKLTRKNVAPNFTEFILKLEKEKQKEGRKSKQRFFDFGE